jgi:hypothetical protein
MATNQERVMGLRRNRCCTINLQSGESISVRARWTNGRPEVCLGLPDGATICNERNEAPPCNNTRRCSKPDHRCKRA